MKNCSKAITLKRKWLIVAVWLLGVAIGFSMFMTGFIIHNIVVILVGMISTLVLYCRGGLYLSMLSEQEDKG
jgi:Zn-dependent membrane protease YugP